MVRGRKRLPSVMRNGFSMLPSANIKRSMFDRSHGYKSTFPVDTLIPVLLDEVLPGDTFILNATHLCRLASPLVAPLMDNLRLDLHAFFVPCRLVYDNWEDFITGGDTPVAWTGDNPASNLFVPQKLSPSDGYKEGSLADYLGLPTKVQGSFRHNVLPFRCYNLVWNTFFRDENLQPEVHVFTSDTDPKVDPQTGEVSTQPDAIVYEYGLLKRNKKHDYFTSALPGLQKGPAIGIGIAGGDSGRLPVHGLAIAGINPNETLANTTPPASALEGYLGIGQSPNPISPAGSNYYNTLYDANGIIKASDNLYRPQSNWGNSNDPFLVVNGDKKITFTYPYNSQTITETAVPITGPDFPIYVDLGSASSVTINALRNAITLQQWYEKNARFGTRYIEQIQGHFGVHTGDYRVQRPIFLGSSKHYIAINSTVQTSSTDSTSPQGNLAAYGLSSDSKRLFTKSFVEHGYVLVLASVTADLTYQQGLPKLFSRFNRFDFYWPTFAHLGEQVVANSEIYCQADSVLQDGVSQNSLPFGYQERFAEYRYKPSQVTGLFRSNATGTLDSWHLSQYFEGLPTLNSTFIQSNTPLSRALAVTDSSLPHILGDFYFSLKCVRPMPIFSVPGLRRI